MVMKGKTGNKSKEPHVTHRKREKEDTLMSSNTF